MGVRCSHSELTAILTSRVLTVVATPPCDVVLQNQASARQGEYRERDAASILGEPVHPERQFSALQVAIDLRALRNCEFAAEGAQERRLMPIDQVQ